MPRIALEGLIGVGKSTVLDRLKDSYRVIHEPIHAWTLLSKFYACPNRYAFSFEAQILLSFLEYNDIHDGIFERCVESALHVFIAMLYENNSLTENQKNGLFALYETIQVAPMDSFIFLDCPVDIAYDRIQKRGRESEASITREYLYKLEKMYNVFKEYLKRKDIKYINIQILGHESPEDIAKIVKSAICQLTQ